MQFDDSQSVSSGEEEKEHKISIGLPGEWAARKTLGPTLDELGADLQRLYRAGRDMILEKAFKKIADADDGKRSNLRVTREVLWNGAFSDNEVCAEYFGGVLAGSRSEDGKDDGAVAFVDTIKSMSSNQLMFHYLIYRSLNILLRKHGLKFNVGESNLLARNNIWLSEQEISIGYKLSFPIDLSILKLRGLLSGYTFDAMFRGDLQARYIKISPTVYGVQLYCAALNRLSDWRKYVTEEMGNIECIADPKYKGLTFEELIEPDSLGSEGWKPREKDR